MDALQELIQRSLQEDVGDGDHSSLCCIPSSARGKAKLLAKETGILAGVRVALEILKAVDENLHLEVYKSDGASIEPGEVIAHLEGPVQSILKAERLLLNCMQRMSGIATQTHAIVQTLAGLDTKVLDTRKTTPGIRVIEKEAVRIGGGTNHRFGLFDMIMLKDNHIDFAGGISKAVQSAREYLEKTGKTLGIEVETRNLEEVQEALDAPGVQRIMLDNFPIPVLKEAVDLIDGRVETEASGGITLETIRSYAETGVDFISVGALTHSVKGLDLSLKSC